MVHDENKKNISVGAVLKVSAVSAVLAVLGMSLTGCNTTEGVGRDVEAAGDAIQDAAD